MATQEILVKYKADVSDLTNQLKLMIERMDKLEAESKQSAKGVDTLTKSVDNLGKEFKEVPKEIPKATAAVKTFATTTTNEVNKLRGSVNTIGKDIAAGIAAGFTVTAVAAFAKASIGAFIEAEQNAEKLRFAVVNIGGEGVDAFEALIQQSERLQDSLNISDDSIQQAQAALVSFGLSAAQVQEVIPVLADFAKLTGQDIPSAAQALGQAIQGRAGEFKKFGVDVSEANTEAENLANILKVLEGQAGSAAAATQTLAGQIEGAKIAVDEFQEGLGGALVLYFKTFIDVVKPVIDSILKSIKELFAVFQTGKSATLEAADGLKILKTAIEVITFPVRVLFEAVNLVIEGITLLARTAKATAAAVVTAFTGIGETIKGIGQGIAQVFSGIADFDGAQITAGLAAIKAPVANLGKEISDAFNEAFKLDLSEETDAEVDKILKSTDKVITRLEAQKKTTQDLIDLQKKFANDNTVFGRSNLKIINDELKAREKITVEMEEQRKKALELKAAIDKNFKAPIVVPVKVEFTEPKPIEPINPVPVTIEPRIDDTQFNDGLDSMGKSIDELFKEWKDKHEDQLNATAKLYDDIVELTRSLTELQLAELQKQTDAQLTALDAQQTAIDEQLDKRRISETEAERRTEQLTKERIAVQKRADAEERRIKKRQFEIDKAAALVKIAINTAVAVTENLGVPVLAALIAVAGAAEAAAVAAQPNPYKKGTKAAKKGLALVDEEGTEAILRGNGRLTTLERGDKVLTAPKTKTYGEVLDAMMDGRFEKYVMQKYVAPQLEKQRKVAAEKRDNDFAENITKSMVINNMGDGESGFHLKKIRQQGLNFSNAREIGREIAKELKQDPYRS